MALWMGVLLAVLTVLSLVWMWNQIQPPNIKTGMTILFGFLAVVFVPMMWNAATRRVRARYHDATNEVTDEAGCPRPDDPSVGTALRPAGPAPARSCGGSCAGTLLVLALLGLAFVVNVLTSPPPNVADHRVVATIRVEGRPGAIAADPITNTLYVTHGNSVSVIDLATRTQTATIGTGDDAQCSVAVDSDAQTLYVAHCSSGGRRAIPDTEVSVIDLATRTQTATITVGRGPGGVALDPATNALYVAHGRNYLSVIDTTTRRVLRTVEVGGDPGDVAVDPATRTVYVANYGGHTVSAIDMHTSTVTATIPVGSGPAAVAVDLETQSVYVANLNDGTVSVIDANTRVVTATIPVGGDLNSMPNDVAVDPAAHTVYVTNSNNGTVTAIDTSTREVIATVAVGRNRWSESGPTDVTVDLDTHTAYVAHSDGKVQVLNLSATPATSTPG